MEIHVLLMFMIPLPKMRLSSDKENTAVTIVIYLYHVINLELQYTLLYGNQFISLSCFQAKKACIVKPSGNGLD